MSETTSQSPYHDYFICHAYEDKQTFVRPLADYLIRNGALIFYDEYSIKLGDSLTEKINQGLSYSQNAIIVLSKFFFEKQWTNAELSGIFQKSLSGDFKLLIIYYEISHQEVLNKYPLLSDILAVDASLGIQQVASKIFEATNFRPSLQFLQLNQIGDSLNSITKSGFSCSIRFQLNHLTDEFIDKYIVDFGNANDLKNRISIKLLRNSIVSISATDKDYRMISISCEASAFKKSPQLLTFNLSPNRSCIELYTNDTLSNSLDGIPQDFFSNFFIAGGGIVFNSLELLNPCPMTVSYLSVLGQQLEPQEIAAHFRAVDDLNRSLGR